MKQGRKFTSIFTLGGQQAEADPLFEEAFLETGEYEAVSSKSDGRCFIIGRTGAGKSALLQRLGDQSTGHAIRINPEDLALPYITNLQAIRFLDSLQINLDTFWITLWKHVLLVEIIRHRYKVDSPAAKQNFLSALRGKITRDRAKTAALDYLDEYEGRFWCEADERVREITDKFAQKIEGAAGASFAGAINVNTAGSFESSVESRGEQVDRFQRIVNDTQLARLNKMINVLDEDVLNESQHFTDVIIDDLDREWVDERIANDLIRCLFQTVIDLKRVKNLKVLVALRTNIFQELDFSRRGGGQEEKFRALVLRMQWTKAELVWMLDQRVEVASFKNTGAFSTVADLLPNTNRSRGNPIDYILERTLMRPRDAIAFLNECLIQGRGKSKLAWTEIHSAEAEYSQNRLLALRDEWKSTYPGIERLFEVFRRAPMPMAKGDFTDRLSEAAMLLADPNFQGKRWLTDATSSIFAAGDPSWFERYHPLFSILYEVGLIGLSTGGSAAPTFYMSDQLASTRETALERASAFYVHRTFHVALDISVRRTD